MRKRSFSEAKKPFKSIDNKINVAILGTSNSIMNGYKEVLGILNCNIVKNISVGSSHSSVIPYRLKQLEGVQADYLIVDIFVNEHRASHYEFNFGELTKEILQYLLAWCQTHKIVPILLIMPTNMTQNRELLARYIGWCQKHSILFFNRFDFIEKLSQVWHRNYQSFFADPAHLNNFMARNLGIALNHCLMNISSVFSKNKVSWVSNKTLIKEFNYINLLDIIEEGSYQTIERKTSMVSEKFLVLKEGDKIKLSTKKDWDIIGLVLNMAKSNACITISSGESRCIKYLDNDYYDPNKDLWLVIWNLSHPCEIKSDNIIIECQSYNSKENNNIFVEYNDHRSLKNNNMDKYEVAIEIAGIILRSSHLSQAYILQTVDMEIDLLSNFNFDIFKTL